MHFGSALGLNTRLHCTAPKCLTAARCVAATWHETSLERTTSASGQFKLLYGPSGLQNIRTGIYIPYIAWCHGWMKGPKRSLRGSSAQQKVLRASSKRVHFQPDVHRHANPLKFRGPEVRLHWKTAAMPIVAASQELRCFR